MDKFLQRKESNTSCVLDRSNELTDMADFQVQHRRCRMQYRFGQAVSRLDRSILLMIAGLLLSVSAFSQTSEGPASPYPTSGQTIHREIPGPVRNIPVRLYTPSMRSRLPLMFFDGSGLVTGRLNTYDVPLYAATDRCDCPVVSMGYQLAQENRHEATSGDAYAVTKWVAVHAEIDGNPKTLAIATPDGTFGLPPMPGLPQTPTNEANRVSGNIDLTTLMAHFRLGLRFRRTN